LSKLVRDEGAKRPEKKDEKHDNRETKPAGQLGVEESEYRTSLVVKQTSFRVVLSRCQKNE